MKWSARIVLLCCCVVAPRSLSAQSNTFGGFVAGGYHVPIGMAGTFSNSTARVSATPALGIGIEGRISSNIQLILNLDHVFGRELQIESCATSGCSTSRLDTNVYGFGVDVGLRLIERFQVAGGLFAQDNLGSEAFVCDCTALQELSSPPNWLGGHAVVRYDLLSAKKLPVFAAVDVFLFHWAPRRSDGHGKTRAEIRVGGGFKVR